MSGRVGRNLWWLGWLGTLSFAGPSLAWTRYLFFFFFAPVVVGVFRYRARGKAEAKAPSASHGVLTARTPTVFAARLLLSQFFALLHPTGVRLFVRQTQGDRAARKRVNGREPDASTHRQITVFTLPFDGEWTVANGGVTGGTSHSWDILSQRFAYDFVKTNSEGSTHCASGSKVEDYFCYGMSILAPADGQIVGTVDGIRDAPRPGSGWLDWSAPELGGNSVTIRHNAREYSYLAHLVCGSVTVVPGQAVVRGQVVGRCGSSGHSTEPHLHFQVQDDPDFVKAVGLPVRFADVIDVELGRVHEGYLTARMRVRPAETPTKKDLGGGQPQPSS